MLERNVADVPFLTTNVRDGEEETRTHAGVGDSD